MPFKFSVVSIGKNESKTLPYLIESCKSFRENGGEYVYMDTGSDKEEAVIMLKSLEKEVGVKIFYVGTRFLTTLTDIQAQRINSLAVGKEKVIARADMTVFNYSAARNHAATLASNDMILMLDCSDRFENFEYKTLNEMVEKGVRRFRYKMALGDSPFDITRFYDRRLEKWVGTIHEVLTCNHESSTKTPYLDEKILYTRHHKQDKPRGHYILGMALDYFANQGKDPRNQYYIGREFNYMDMWKSSNAMLQKHVDNPKSTFAEEKNSAYCHMAWNWLALNDENKAMECLKKAIDVCPYRRQPFIQLCEIYAKRNCPIYVLMYALASLAVDKPGQGYVESAVNYTYLPHLFAYRSLLLMDRKEEAYQHYKAVEHYGYSDNQFITDFENFVGIQSRKDDDKSVVFKNNVATISKMDKVIEQLTVTMMFNTKVSHLSKVIKEIHVGNHKIDPRCICYANTVYEGVDKVRYDGKRVIFPILLGNRLSCKGKEDISVKIVPYDEYEGKASHMMIKYDDKNIDSIFNDDVLIGCKVTPFMVKIPDNKECKVIFTITDPDVKVKSLEILSAKMEKIREVPLIDGITGVIPGTEIPKTFVISPSHISKVAIYIRTMTL